MTPQQTFYANRAEWYGDSVQSAVRLAIQYDRFPRPGDSAETMADYAVNLTRVAAHFGRLALTSEYSANIVTLACNLENR